MDKGNYMQNFFLDSRINRGLTYEDYFSGFKAKAELEDFSAFPTEEFEHLKMAKLNFQRSSRIHRTFSPSVEIKELIAEITEPQIWMVISEDWCGDSAQNIPYIAELAKLNPIIELKIFPRDANPDIIDMYLTNGTRSIPKLVAFDTDGNELFQWGPRPNQAVELIAKLKAEGKTKEEFLEQLHLWYGRNRGSELLKELSELIKNVLVNDRS